MPGSPGAAALVCSRVTVTVPTASGELTLLRDLDVSLGERRVAVLGLNGSGKSTLLRLFNGLVRPSSGTVTVHGTDVARDVRAARRRVGFVFTDPLSQLVMPTPVEDVELSLRGAGVPRARRRTAALELLERAGIGHRAEHSIYDLSGGERQLAAFAAVLAVEPEVLVLDEPTTLLDLRNRGRLMGLLDGLPHQLLISTHDLGLAATAPRVLVLHEGALVADGPPEEVVPAYERWCAHGFPGEARP
ncbi:cobalt ABC transporter ATP-binding protein [Kocuria rosea]|uniref:energy-coupling factor ABC transporter ATP-binding protein n=1 Tax=Kocuria rosea TaxID=1275 RepID=UPI000D65D686|nr:ABC transporter ATP-binding protein [Kocuria rosea]PWF85002.1 cobalt ABC transporter ATP-binding protein [Kocuria rosea]QCY33225.1 ABC transporter ATP-binding protein [Kocuria rosea]TQN36255.1 biotin transport system ATP-binding protein [Kocuria rosea]